MRDLLSSISIQTLCNESRERRVDRGAFVLGGIDDRTLGTPDWERVVIHVLARRCPLSMPVRIPATSRDETGIAREIQAGRRAIWGGSEPDPISVPTRSVRTRAAARVLVLRDVRQQRHERHQLDGRWGITAGSRGPQRVVRHTIGPSRHRHNARTKRGRDRYG
jgi:hypothetical protein